MKFMQQAGSWLLAGALGMSMSLAHASAGVPAEVAPFTTQAGSVIAPVGGPGAQAMPTFSITFDPQFDLAGFTLNLDYRDDLMSFNAAASTVGSGATVMSLSEAFTTLAGASSPGDFVVFPPSDNPGAYSVSAFYFVGTFPIAPQTVTFTAVFDLLPAFTAGSQANVTFSGSLEDTLASYPIQGVATVTAVPEPETWLMLLGGLGLVASRVRRRNR